MYMQVCIYVHLKKVTQFQSMFYTLMHRWYIHDLNYMTLAP